MKIYMVKKAYRIRPFKFEVLMTYKTFKEAVNFIVKINAYMKILPIFDIEKDEGIVYKSQSKEAIYLINTLEVQE